MSRLECSDRSSITLSIDKSHFNPSLNILLECFNLTHTIFTFNKQTTDRLKDLNYHICSQPVNLVLIKFTSLVQYQNETLNICLDLYIWNVNQNNDRNSNSFFCFYSYNSWWEKVFENLWSKDGKKTKIWHRSRNAHDQQQLAISRLSALTFELEAFKVNICCLLVEH